MLRLLTDAPAIQLMDGAFYRTVPDSFVDELEAALREADAPETPRTGKCVDGHHVFIGDGLCCACGNTIQPVPTSHPAWAEPEDAHDAVIELQRLRSSQMTREAALREAAAPPAGLQGQRKAAKAHLLIDTKGDVEAACRIERFDGDDYLAYAIHNIKAAIEKREDAPCSAAEHAKAAQVALQLERRPTYADVCAQWKRETEEVGGEALGRVPPAAECSQYGCAINRQGVASARQESETP